MSSNNLFGGPRTILVAMLVVLAVALIAVAATFLVRGVMGTPDGPPPASVVTTTSVPAG
ncbi:hypothetical protein ACNHUS_24785 [Actinomycetes bacterium M1A6_2h]